MVSRRLVILLVLLAAAFAAVFVAAPGARRGATSAAVAAAARPASPPDAAEASAGGTGASYLADCRARLEAVRTVKLFCDLVDDRRLWDAAGLFAGPRLWTRAQLRTVRALTFDSARVITEPDAATVTVAAAALAESRPGGPVPSGAVTLFVTLGRVGGTEGGWLIEAITARPQPQRKGSK